MTQDVGRVPSGQALMNEAPVGLRPAGFDPSRIRLNGWEVKALTALATADRDHFWPFAKVGKESGVPQREVRRIVRLLARKGLAEFSAALWTDDGHPAGAGYRLTTDGRSLVSEGSTW